MFGPLVLAALLAPRADAFCGAYVGAPGTTITNEASAVIAAREGTTTTLTLASDVQGDARDFAMVIPVPSVLTAEDVSIADPDLVDRITQYTTPRVVSYTCDTALTEVHSPRSTPGCGLMLGCSDSSATFDGSGVDGPEAEGSVTVESAFTTAEYDIVVLSADEGAGLRQWLNDNGYALPEGGDDVLQEYIDAGAYFLAAKVSLDAAPTGREWLSPLQIRYDSPVFGIPIRIGTISSAGTQDLVVYALNDGDQGSVGIANYPEIALDTDCMWKKASDDETLEDFYEREIDDALAQQGTGWWVEHSWNLSIACDPCTTQDPFTTQELQSLGLGVADYHVSVQVTRLHMRYRPEDATEDLVLYTDNQPDQRAQLRYIEYRRELEFLFPVCGEGYVDDPGECGDALDTDSPRATSASCGIASPPLTGAIVLVGALIRRRRR